MEDGDIKIISVSPTALEQFCLYVFSGCFVFDGDQFRQPFCAKFSLAKFSDMATTASFPIPVAAHSSLIVMRPSSWISASALSLVSFVTFIAGRQQRLMHQESELPHHTRFSGVWHLYRSGAFRSQKFNHHVLPIFTSWTPAILHCYCLERTWLTAASIILVEVDSVAPGG